MNHGLKPAHWDAILEVLRKHPRVHKAILFGSRAMGTFTKESDIDLCLVGDELTLDDQAELLAEFEKLPMAQTVDLVLENKIDSPAFLEHVRKEGKTVFEGGSTGLGMGGELREWRDCKLGDVLELKRGYDLPSQHRHPGPVPIVSSSGPSGFHSEAMVKAPGVVTGRYGTIGEVFFVTQDFWPLNTTLYVRDFKGSDPKFVSYFLKTIDFYSCSDKAAVPGVNRNHLHELPVRVPPLAAQRAIARILGALDDKIELNRKMNATLEAMARALFKSWFVDFDPVRAKADGRAPSGMDAETAKLFPSEFVDSELGPIPKGWHVRPVLDLANLISGGTPNTSNAAFWDGNVKWASAKDVSQCGSFFLTSTERTITKAGLEGSSTKVIPKDAVVVVARGATCGRFTVFAEPIAMNQTCYALAAKSPSARWYLRFLAEELLVKLVAQAHGSVFDTITTTTFRAAPAIHPDDTLLCRFEAIVAPSIERIRVLHYESAALARIRDELLPRLLSGELSVARADRDLEASGG